MKSIISIYSIFALLLVSCSDDNNSSPNRNNNGGGGGNNSGCSGGPNTVTDIDGNIYNVVTIGNQCWMKENLKVSKYRNGQPIVTNLSNNQWLNTTSGAYAIQDNNPANNDIYGKLYNWYTIADPRGLCPSSWHIPTDSEWKTLVKALDPQADTSSFYTPSQIAGGLMKTTGTLQAGTGLWENPNYGATNSSDFTGLPGGYRDHSGHFQSIGYSGIWWTSTEYSTLEAFTYGTRHDYEYLGRGLYINYHAGFSVRCVRD